MVRIKNETEYKVACDRINELLKVVNGQTPMTHPNMIELTHISGLVEEYEHIHYPVQPTTLIETINLRMYELGLTQKKLKKNGCSVLFPTPFLHPKRERDDI